MENRKRTFISLLILIITTIISFFAFVPINRKESNNSHAWMACVSDDYLINELSIPGSHDSGATHSIFDVSGKCQDLSITTQLNIGVRFFDIRLQLINDEFKIVHSFVDQKLTFTYVLSEMYQYIKENSSEFLIISIKKEQNSKNSMLNFEDALLRDFKDFEDVICYDSSLPSKIKDARGKIYILSRNQSSFGMPAYNGWKDSTTFTLGDFYIQDNYCINDIEVKKEDIKSTIKYSSSNNDKFVLNFTSCYLDGGFPPTYAGTTAVIINNWLEEYLPTIKGCLGVMIMDFITLELSESIYERNIV